MTEPAPAKALVVLPFESAEKAETFASLVITQLPEAAAPFVIHGTAYEYVVTESGERGQVVEVFPESRFDVFQGTQGEQHVVLQRKVMEAGDAGTGGSEDPDGPGGGAGEGG